MTAGDPRQDENSLKAQINADDVISSTSVRCTTREKLQLNNRKCALERTPVLHFKNKSPA